MKMKNILTAAAIAFTLLATPLYAQKSVIPPTQLPAAAQAFIKNNFKGIAITTAQVEKEFFDTDYKAYLANGIEIEFNDKGQWEEIDGNHNNLPASVIPAAVNTYINTNFKGQHVVQIEKKRWGYEVELTNGLELEFDTAGKFLRIDD